MQRKILLVDENKFELTLIKNSLKKEYDVISFANSEEAFKYIQKNNDISVIIIDIKKSVFEKNNLLNILKNDTKYSSIPIIVTTSINDEKLHKKIIDYGANSFIIKPFSNFLLLNIIKNVINGNRSISNNEYKNKLTGLLSRETFLQEVDNYIKKQEAEYYVMACLDIENFKVVNDKYGISKGDELLKHVGKCISDFFNDKGALISHISSDKFAVLYIKKSINNLKLNDLINEIVLENEIDSKIKVRIGLYTINDLSLSSSSMFDRAAMAEESIRGKYGVNIVEYDDSMRISLLKEQLIVSNMNSAITNGEFIPYFQPQYNHETKALVGAEALVRWKKDEEYIPPDEFIPIFENNGFIYEMDQYILEQIVKLLRKWMDEGKKPLPISVNVSRVDLFHKDFISTFTGIIKKYRVPYHLIKIEITESAFSKDSEVIISKVNRLINMGFVVEIDDFGSGYSSLNTLKDVSAQILKLDIRFLEKTRNRKRSSNILKSIIEMAKNLDMAVIAEGVENKYQADYLKSIGCNYIQGFYYSKPITAKEYEKIMDTTKKEETLLVHNEEIDENKIKDYQYQFLSSNIPGGVASYYLINDKIKIIYVNDEYYNILGYTKEEYFNISNKDPLLLIFKEDREQFKKLETALSTIEEKEKKYNFTYRSNTKNGGYKWLNLLADFIKVGEEQYIVNVIKIDITEQQEEKERLRVSEEEYRIAASHSGNAIGKYDINKKTLTVTKETAKMFELPEYIENVPQDCIKLGTISEDTKDDYVAFYEKIKNGEKECIATFKKRIYGEWRWVRENSTTIFNNNGEPTTAIITYADITEEQEKESIYKKWRQNLYSKNDSDYALYRANLNKNSFYDRKVGNLLDFHIDTKGEKKLNEIMKEFADNYIFEGDRKSYLKITNSDTMLADYYRDKRLSKYEFRAITASGKLHWIRLTIELVEYPNTKDIQAYMMYEDIHDTKTEELEVNRQAKIDPLTGLLNRKAFVTAVEKILNNKKDGTISALLMIDMDGFKFINDNFGHSTGDQLLIDTGKAITYTLKTGDLVGRLGGDEFIVFLNSEKDQESVLNKAKEICARVQNTAINNMNLSISLGISLCPIDGNSFTELYIKADKAMYYVKEHGKNSCLLYSEALDKKIWETNPKKTHKKDDSKLKMIVGGIDGINISQLKNIFSNEFDIKCIDSKDEMQYYLQSHIENTSIIIFNFNMNDKKNVEALKKIKKIKSKRQVPLIVMGDKKNYESAINAIKLGAEDYVVIPTNNDYIYFRIKRAIYKYNQ